MTDVRCYFTKAQMFSNDIYDEDHRRMASELMPGFELIEIVGGPIRVVGIVNKTGCIEQLDEMSSKRHLFARFFFLHVLAKAIDRLPVMTRTRKNNLTLQVSHCNTLPEYFRVYSEDLDELSTALSITQRALPANTPYKFYFSFFKFGQQLHISHPVDISSVGLSSIVHRAHKIHSCSIHFATTLTHASIDYSTLWNIRTPSHFYTGHDVKKISIFWLI